VNIFVSGLRSQEEISMHVKASPERTLSLACLWSRDQSTGRLQAQWLSQAPVKFEDILRHFVAPAK
jgi:hypothetical protein